MSRRAHPAELQVEWNATFIEGEAAQEGLVDEFWFWVYPDLWPAGRGSSTVSAPSASS